MLVALAVIAVLVWGLAMVTGRMLGGAIYLLLVIAAGLLLLHVYQRRRA